MKFKAIIAAAVLALSSVSALAADLYVDGNAGKDWNAGTASAPVATIYRAFTKAQPGDTIHVLPTTTYPYVWLGNKSGVAGKPITIKGQDTKIDNAGEKHAFMLDKVSHVVIEGFDVRSTGYGSSGSWQGIFFKNGQDVTIRNNRVTAACSGIQTYSADHVRITDNEVYGSAKVTKSDIFCSGISVHENLDYDTNTTDYKYVIERNKIYGNINVPFWSECGTYCRNSDGSGIIIDDSRRTQTDNRSYKGRHLVANNIIFDNGGRGIASFYSDNVDIFNNTIFHNNTDPYEAAWNPGEIGITDGGGHRVFYNILVNDGAYKDAKTGTKHGISIQNNNTRGKIEVDHNVIWNTKNAKALMVYQRYNSIPVVIGSGNLFMNPQIKNLTIDPATLDPRVVADSPIRQRPMLEGLYTKYDYQGVMREWSVCPGAYQKSWIYP